jgi:hypothetical protein
MVLGGSVIVRGCDNRVILNDIDAATTGWIPGQRHNRVAVLSAFTRSQGDVRAAATGIGTDEPVTNQAIGFDRSHRQVVVIEVIDIPGAGDAVAGNIAAVREGRIGFIEGSRELSRGLRDQEANKECRRRDRRRDVSGNEGVCSLSGYDP